MLFVWIRYTNVIIGRSSFPSTTSFAGASADNLNGFGQDDRDRFGVLVCDVVAVVVVNDHIWFYCLYSVIGMGNVVRQNGDRMFIYTILINVEKLIYQPYSFESPQCLLSLFISI